MSVLSFFSQLDWKSPYTYLAILGTLGAPSTIWKAYQWISRLWNTSFLRFRYRSIHNDFYYKNRDFGYRVMEDGVTYLNVRRETVVPLVKGVAGIPINYRWTGIGDITPTLLPNNLTLEDAPKIVGKISVRKLVRFESPLDKRREYSYNVLLSCRADNHQPEPFISSGSSRRVDNLTLRVAFPVDKRPKHVTYRVLDSDGNESAREVLDLSDPLTGEYRKEIKYPRPFSEHRIEWE
jgi:hypothetical protein